MGRKKEYKNRVALSTYIEFEEMQALDQIRWREHKDISVVIREAILEYVKAHTSGNSSFKLDNWTNDPTFQAIPTLLADNKTWFPYLKDCTISERAKILKQANTVRSLAISSGPLKE